MKDRDTELALLRLRMGSLRAQIEPLTGRRNAKKRAALWARYEKLAAQARRLTAAEVDKWQADY